MQIDPEKIVEFSIQGGTPYYRVRWHDAWVEEESLSHTWQHLIDNFWKIQSEQHSTTKYAQNTNKLLPNFSSLLSNSCITQDDNQHSMNSNLTELRSTSVHPTTATTLSFNSSFHYPQDSSHHQQNNGLVQFNNDSRNLTQHIAGNEQFTKTPSAILGNNDVFRHQPSIEYTQPFPLSVPDFTLMPDRTAQIKDSLKEKVTQKSQCVKKVASKARVVRKIKPTLQADVSSCSDNVICSDCGRDFSRTVKPKKRLREHVRRMHLKNGKFKCLQCPKTFVCQQGLRDHEPVHSKERKHSCSYCNETFLRLSHLYIHLRTHEEEKNFRCEACFGTFNVQSELKDHCDSKHSSVSANVKCGVCKQNLYSAQSVYSHSLRHSGTRNFKCDVCGSKFKRKQILDQHKKRHETNVTSQSFQCNVCKKELTTKSSLREHMFLVHKKSLEETDHKCEVCGKCFRNWANYRRHVQLHPKLLDNSTIALAQEKDVLDTIGANDSSSHRFKCNICSQEFDTTKSMLEHLKEHQATPNTEVATGAGSVEGLACSVCLKAFTNRKYLRSHMQIHKSIELKCDVCGMLFKRKDTLRMHKKRHIERNETASTFTNKSGEMYNVRRELRDKIGKADQDGRVSCPYCKKVFNTRKLLLAHIVLHGDVFHSCDICGKSYKQKSCLNKHRKTHMNKATKASRVTKQRKVLNQITKLNQSRLTRKKQHQVVEESSNCVGEAGLKQSEVSDEHLKNSDQQGVAKEDNVSSEINLTTERSESHEENNPMFVCRTCDKVFPTKKQLRSHQLSHSDTIHNCAVCGKTYLRRDFLSKHMIKVHGSRNIGSEVNVSVTEDCNNELVKNAVKIVIETQCST